MANLNEAMTDDQAIATSLLDVNLNDVPDEEAVDPGEYELSVIDARIGRKDEQSDPYLLVRFEVVGEPTAKDVTHVMMLPVDTDDEKRSNRKKRRLIEFFEAAGIDISQGQFDTNEFPGLTCWAALRVENNEQYGEQNRISRFLTGA